MGAAAWPRRPCRVCSRADIWPLRAPPKLRLRCGAVLGAAHGPSLLGLCVYCLPLLDSLLQKSMGAADGSGVLEHRRSVSDDTTVRERAVRVDRAARPAFDLVTSKLRRPQIRSGTVR